MMCIAHGGTFGRARPRISCDSFCGVLLDLWRNSLWRIRGSTPLQVYLSGLQGHYKRNIDWSLIFIFPDILLLWDLPLEKTI